MAVLRTYEIKVSRYLLVIGRRRDPAVRAAGYEPDAIMVLIRAKRSHVALGLAQYDSYRKNNALFTRMSTKNSCEGLQAHADIPTYLPIYLSIK